MRKLTNHMMISNFFVAQNWTTVISSRNRGLMEQKTYTGGTLILLAGPFKIMFTSSLRIKQRDLRTEVYKPRHHILLIHSGTISWTNRSLLINDVRWVNLFSYYTLMLGLVNNYSTTTLHMLFYEYWTHRIKQSISWKLQSVFLWILIINPPKHSQRLAIPVTYTFHDGKCMSLTNWWSKKEKWEWIQQSILIRSENTRWGLLLTRKFCTWKRSEKNIINMSYHQNHANNENHTHTREH